MATDLTKRTALVVDSGLYTHIAEKLAESFGSVLYFVEWRGQFPTSKWARVGTGLKNVKRVTSLWDSLDKADIVIFLDIYNSDIQEHLRRLGHRVWGNGAAEELETDRYWMKNYLEARGFPVNEFIKLEGLDALIKHIKDERDLWIKGGLFRGDFESFHFDNLWLARPWFDELRHSLGPFQDKYEFLVESPIEGVEVGYDGFSVDGQFPTVASYGYEAKDAGYIGQVYEGKPPAAIARINECLAPLLRGASARGFLSIELRIGKSREPYLLDPCMRCGSPPSEAYIELFSNWAEVIWEGAAGTLIDLEPVGQFAAQLMLKSDWARDNWLAVDVPPRLSKWVKLHNHCRVDGDDYVVPSGIAQIGAVIGVGATLADAITMCHDNADGIKAYELDYAEDAFQECMKAIDEGKQYGIDW